MPAKQPLDPRFMELASRFLDGEATPEELESLNDLLYDDSRALDTLAELLNQHGALAWTQRGQASFKGIPVSETSAGTGRDSGPAPRRAWWIAIPLAACLLVTVGIIRFAPGGSPSGLKINPSQTAPVTPEERTLSCQDGVSPSQDYRGTRDTMLLERDAATPRGSEPLLEVDGESSGRPALLQWDLREIPPGSRVISASLDLTVTSVSPGGECEAQMLSRPWVESQATWIEFASGRRWEVPGGRGGRDRDSQVLAHFKPVRGLLSIPLNDAGLTIVQRWINSADSNHGLILKMSNPAGEFSFHSRESGIASKRPKLTVSYSPAIK